MTTAAEPDETLESALIADLDRMVGAVCIDCGRALCGHAVLSSVALGFRYAPRCPACLAAGLRQPLAELVSRLADYVQRRDCYRRAWDTASDREGVPRSPRPTCVLGGELSDDSTVRDEPPAAIPTPAAEWDAGGLACGDLVMGLRLRLQSLRPGTAIRVIATDPAAPQDLPAWCRLTGHRLVAASHPVYLIQRR